MKIYITFGEGDGNYNASSIKGFPLVGGGGRRCVESGDGPGGPCRVSTRRCAKRRGARVMCLPAHNRSQHCLIRKTTAL